MFMPPENISLKLTLSCQLFKLLPLRKFITEPYAKELLAHEFSNAVQQTFEKNSVPVLLNLDQPQKGLLEM